MSRYGGRYGTVGAGGGESFRGQLLDSGEEVFPRHLASLSTLATGTGSLRLSYFTARKTESCTKVRVCSGGTGAGATPTLAKLGVWSVAADGTLTLLAGTANDTALLASTGTEYERTLTSTFNKVAGVRYAVGVLVVTAAAAPTLIGATAAVAAVAGRAPRLSALVAAQADLPASVAAASLTNSSSVPYFEVAP